ncbi:MAG: hypothetical protein JKY94_14775 [Rhodobacteraceae bacterium]|nr:hypothetical protein [Paracoccaceae bacterium]
MNDGQGSFISNPSANVRASVYLVSDNRQGIVQTIFQQGRNNPAVMNLTTGNNHLHQWTFFIDYGVNFACAAHRLTGGVYIDERAA